ncbi:MAG TPA: hypothetical protein VLD62_05830, partial [Acidimicrobiia bacterium]|nr:hypothetical protein [Acidimicrobiia bacterium]
MTATDHRPSPVGAATGSFLVEEGTEWYRIDDFDRLDPFLVSVVSATDQWMFVSSSGALTAGRVSAGSAVFSYETDDRLHRSGGLQGPITLVRVGDEVWEPFAPHAPFGQVRRSIAKTAMGDRLRFEEHHAGLGLTFRATWAPSHRFGFVRTCELLSETSLEVELLDGLVDVLPAGVDLPSQQTSSTLVDAYRRSELDPSGIGVFSLEALVSDRAEPAESLRASVVWSTGLDDAVVALSDAQLRAFRSGEALVPEHLVKGRKGSYLLAHRMAVDPAAPLRWSIVVDVERDQGALAELRTWLRTADDPASVVAESIEATSAGLVDVVGRADAVQETADRASSVHHLANVLFNVMRGGVFLDDHRIVVADVQQFVDDRNRAAAERFRAVAAGLPPVVEVTELREAVSGDPDLERLAAEFLPLSFSRRHGDPSRPWNTFRISVRSEAGELTHGYEGNWCDIFQNWDALLHSYPE